MHGDRQLSETVAIPYADPFRRTAVHATAPPTPRGSTWVGRHGVTGSMALHSIDCKIRPEETLPYAAFRALEQRSQREGRSLSNLAAFLIEQALEPHLARNP
jgi:hypothetical protein